MAAKTDNFISPDYFNVDELLTDEQKLVRESVRNYVKKEISPIIEDYAQRAEFPQQIIKQLGELGCFGPTIPEQYGGGGLDYISYGLMMQELERGDSGVRSTASVQGSLVMFPIYQYGNEEQRNKYLPKLASGEWLGCFGLTEPNHGSDPSNMLSNIKDNGDVQSIVSIITPDKKVYSGQSATFRQSLKDIEDVMDGEKFSIIKISGKTKAGRDYINCTLDVAGL